MGEMTIERLTAFGQAWNTSDPELVASYFTEDGVFHAVSGPERLGRTYVGHDQLSQAVRDFEARYPGATFQNLEVSVAGDRGVLEWDLVGPDGDVIVAGCDLLHFRGDKVQSKSAFTKRRTT